MKQIAIRASALTRQFSSVRALNDLTIEVPAGVVFGFLGPNGAGKTTTIRLLLNLIEPTSGSAEVLGFDTRTHGWLLTIITIVVGVITINAANWSGHVRSAASWLGIILLPPLVGGAVASAGMLASLHAATVRQAQQTLMFGIIAVGLALSFGLPTLLNWLARNLAAWSAAEVVVGGSAVFLAVDLVLVLAALNRFQRSKLVLD